MMAAQSVCCWVHFTTDFCIRWVLEKPEFSGLIAYTLDAVEKLRSLGARAILLRK
jgi:hypothetical protein